MRELTFAIEYDAGSDPIMDVFLEYPSLVAHSIDGFVTKDQFWRLERITGPESALDRLERIRFDDFYCGEAITERRCEADRYHDSIERSANELVLYTYLRISGAVTPFTLSRGNTSLQDWSSRLVVENRLIGGGS